VRYKVYLAERANVPYYLYRVSGVDLVRRFRLRVQLACGSVASHAGTLRGFFADEGNVKAGKRDVRALRIAQAKRHPLEERILRHHGISFRYSERGKSVNLRLLELAGLGLVEKVNSKWRRIDAANRVIVK
jgi:hypothetical protein